MDPTSEQRRDYCHSKGEKVFIVRDLENKKSTTILNDFKIVLHTKESALMLPLNFYSLRKIKLLRIGEEAQTIVFPNTQLIYY